MFSSQFQVNQIIPINIMTFDNLIQKQFIILQQNMGPSNQPSLSVSQSNSQMILSSNDHSFEDKVDEIKEQSTLNFGRIKIFRMLAKPYDYLIKITEQIIDEAEIAKNAIKKRTQFYSELDCNKNMAKISHMTYRQNNEVCIEKHCLDVYIKYYNFTLDDTIALKKKKKAIFRQSELIFILNALISIGMEFKNKHSCAYTGSFKSHLIYVSPEGYIKMYPFLFRGCINLKEEAENQSKSMKKSILISSKQAGSIQSTTKQNTPNRSSSQINKSHIYQSPSINSKVNMVSPSTATSPLESKSYEIQFSLQQKQSSRLRQQSLKDANVNVTRIKNYKDDIQDIALLLLQLIFLNSSKQYYHDDFSPKKSQICFTVERCLAEKKLSNTLKALLRDIVKQPSKWSYEEIENQIDKIREIERVKVIYCLRFDEEWDAQEMKELNENGSLSPNTNKVNSLGNSRMNGENLDSRLIEMKDEKLRRLSISLQNNLIPSRISVSAKSEIKNVND